MAAAVAEATTGFPVPVPALVRHHVCIPGGQQQRLQRNRCWARLLPLPADSGQEVPRGEANVAAVEAGGDLKVQVSGYATRYSAWYIPEGQRKSQGKHRHD